MVYLYVTARKLDILDASARGFKLMVLNFEKLITTKEFLDLEVQQIMELFNVDEIGARSEVIVFMAALKWLDYHYTDREEYIREVLGCVRFPLMNTEEILACYHPPVLPGLMVLPEIRETLLNATCYITAKSLGQEALFSELAAKPRTFLFGGEPMILWDVSVFDTERYEIGKRQNAVVKIQAMFRGYETRKRLQEEILIVNYAATVIQAVWRGYIIRKSLRLTKTAMQRKGRSSKKFLLRKDSRSGLLRAYSKRTFEIFDPEIESEQPVMIYVMGAFDSGNGEGNSIFSLDITNMKWKLIAKCPEPRHDARIVMLYGYLYIIGGFNPLSRTETGLMLPLKTCLRLHLGSGDWRDMPPTNTARSSHAAAIFNEQILSIGGKDETNRILSSIERYDLSVGRWKPFNPPLPEPRMAMGCIVHQGMLWVSGGITGNGSSICMMDSVWCLDNKTCRWTKKVSLQQATAFPSLISEGESSLLCVGGAIRPLSYDRDELESIDKIYRLERGRWVEQRRLPFQCHSIVGCCVGKRVYILSGFSSHTMAHTEEPVSLDLEEEEEKVVKLGKLPVKAAKFIVDAVVL